MNLLDLARAALADPPAENRRNNATPDQAAELRALVVLLFGDDTDAHQADALAAALADPVGALTSFRMLAAELEDQR